MTQQTKSRSLKAILGVALAAVGLLLLFVNLDNATADWSRPFASRAESLGAVFELGLAGLRATQAYFFDHASFRSGVVQLFLAFWPVVLVLFGAAMLQNTLGGRILQSDNGSRRPAPAERK